jgi:omega-6 fatty acid desaturase (delta-12 desaturase)
MKQPVVLCADKPPTMRTKSDLVRATKPYARDDRRRSWWHLWSSLVVLGGFLSLTCVTEWHWLVRVPFSVLAGLVLVRLFIIFHDYQHGTILRGSWLANAILFVFGLLTLSPPSVWKSTHNYHHRNNAQVPGADIGTFPVMTTETYAQVSWLKRLQYHVARHPLTILFGYFTVFLYSLCLRSFLARPKEHFDSGIALVLQAAVVVGLALWSPSLLFLTFLVPLLTATALGAYLFYAQHNFPEVQFQSRDDWDYVFAALKSSSYMKMNPVMQWFTGNIGYHHVHHLNAHIPFYRLPEAMAGLEELQTPRTTSLNPLDIYRCLRLKLWDPAQGRLVSFSGK